MGEGEGKEGKEGKAIKAEGEIGGRKAVKGGKKKVGKEKKVVEVKVEGDDCEDEGEDEDV